MGRITVRGREAPIEVYEPAGEFPAEALKRLDARWRRFDAGEAGALAEIEALSAEFPEDEPLKELVERLRAVGPGGVYHLD